MTDIDTNALLGQQLANLLQGNEKRNQDFNQMMDQQRQTVEGTYSHLSRGNQQINPKAMEIAKFLTANERLIPVVEKLVTKFQSDFEKAYEKQLEQVEQQLGLDDMPVDPDPQPPPTTRPPETGSRTTR